MSVLEIQDLSIRFGGLQALQDVSLEVNEYEIVGLIGPNGAGKTTAFNCITGFYTPGGGRVLYRGKDVTKSPPHVKARMGFGRTFQNVGMVKSATALENLKTAQHAKASYDVVTGLIGGPKSWQGEREMTAKAEAILDLLGLSRIRNMRVGGQSYGTLKLLELGCALATDPDILLLDEPTSGMGPDESDQLGERLLVLRREFGLTMLVIEHHVPLVLRVCDHVYVLNFGRMLAQGTPSEVQSHPEVIAAYLGGEAPEALAATNEPEQDASMEEALHHERPVAAKQSPPRKAPAKTTRQTTRKAGSKSETKAASRDESKTASKDESKDEAGPAAEEQAGEQPAKQTPAASLPKKRRARTAAQSRDSQSNTEGENEGKSA